MRPYGRSSSYYANNAAKGAQRVVDKDASVAFHARVRNWVQRKQAGETPAPVQIRPICIDDASHVIDSWVRSFRPSQTVGPVEAPVFHIEQRARINRLISRSKTFVACDPVDRRLIRGWIVFEPPRALDQIPIVHFVCVHPSYQLQGIGTALVELARATHTDKDLPMWSTHETQPMRHIRPRWNLSYNPYLLEVDHRVAAKTAIGTAAGASDPYGFTDIPRA